MTSRRDLGAADLQAASWRKSSYTANAGNCVEITNIPGTTGVAVRDSKNTAVPPTRLSRKAWADFLGAVVDGSFIRL